MRAVVQRVAEASVEVDGAQVAAIGRGLLVLVGVEQGDTDREADLVAARVAKLRIFASDAKPMDRDVRDVGGEVLVVSQFTGRLHENARRMPVFGFASLRRSPCSPT